MQHWENHSGQKNPEETQVNAVLLHLEKALLFGAEWATFHLNLSKYWLISCFNNRVYYKDNNRENIWILKRLCLLLYFGLVLGYDCKRLIISSVCVCSWMLTQRYLLPSDTGTWSIGDWSLSCWPPSSICLLKQMNRLGSQPVAASKSPSGADVTASSGHGDGEGSIKGNDNKGAPRCWAAHHPRLNATVLLTSLLFRENRRRGSLNPTDTAYIYF